jgi:hypothetical protein
LDGTSRYNFTAWPPKFTTFPKEPLPKAPTKRPDIFVLCNPGLHFATQLTTTRKKKIVPTNYDHHMSLYNYYNPDLLKRILLKLMVPNGTMVPSIALTERYVFLLFVLPCLLCLICFA